MITGNASYDQDEIDAFNFVSLTFQTDRRLVTYSIFSFFDTDSPVSFIKVALVPKQLVGYL